jgi:integrase
MADIVHRHFAKSTSFPISSHQDGAKKPSMEWSLFDLRGRRKYLSPAERADFISAVLADDTAAGTLCLTLVLTGARISEALALTADRIDRGEGCIVFETLKRRRRGVFRAVPVPTELIDRLLGSVGQQYDSRGLGLDDRIWSFSRTTAWKKVKQLMLAAGVDPSVAKPRALRHAFGVEAVQQRIALSLVKRWLGHAKIETTAIYANPVGEEERALARLMW